MPLLFSAPRNDFRGHNKFWVQDLRGGKPFDVNGERVRRVDARFRWETQAVSNEGYFEEKSSSHAVSYVTS
jgi:hypothetical protein